MVIYTCNHYCDVTPLCFNLFPVHYIDGRSSFFASTAPRVGIVGTGTSEDVGPGAYVGTGGMGDSLMTDPIWIEKQYKQSVRKT